MSRFICREFHTHLVCVAAAAVAAVMAAAGNGPGGSNVTNLIWMQSTFF